MTLDNIRKCRIGSRGRQTSGHSTRVPHRRWPDLLRQNDDLEPRHIRASSIMGSRHEHHLLIVPRGAAAAEKLLNASSATKRHQSVSPLEYFSTEGTLSCSSYVRLIRDWRAWLAWAVILAMASVRPQKTGRRDRLALKSSVSRHPAHARGRRLCGLGIPCRPSKPCNVRTSLITCMTKFPKCSCWR